MDHLPNRPPRRTQIRWALLLSLMLNHVLLVPVTYLLLHQPPPPPPPPVDVELVDPPPPKEKELQPAIKLPAPERLAKQAPERKKKKRLKLPRPRPLAKRPPLQKQPPKPKEQPVDPPQRIPRLKMVEVDNPESKAPPKNARFLSDKNRQVLRETRARLTNLVKNHPRPKATSSVERKRPDPGSKKQTIAELRRQRSPSKKVEERRRRPKPKKVSDLLKMRSAQTKVEPQKSVKPVANASDRGDLPAPREERKAQRFRRAQKARISLSLDYRDFDRIYGQTARKQRERARLNPSKKSGRHQRRWRQMRAALENFVPEVQPGNQTALGTRANPFAIFIARMHRKIHRLWGFGFLVDLDNKADSHPMNDMRLWTMVEVVVAPDGSIKKATIVKPSGLLPFDVAALSTVFTGAPYPRTPRSIRSRNGYVYLHWRFHRNHRQCGTFGVDPYILTTPPKGPIDGDLAEVGSSGSRSARRLNRGVKSGPMGRGMMRPLGRNHGHARAPARSRRQAVATGKERLSAAKRASTQNVRSSDPAARQAAQRFLDGFSARSPAKMIAASHLPFSSQGKVVARSYGALKGMFTNLIEESSSRKTSGLTLLTAMEARKLLGHLPRGMDYGEPRLAARVRLGKAIFTMLLQRIKDRWRVVGLNR